MHPIVLLQQTPIAGLVGVSPQLPIASVKGVEYAWFGNNVVIVNRRSSPVDIRGLRTKRQGHQIPTVEGWVTSHAAAYLQLSDLSSFNE